MSEKLPVAHDIIIQAINEFDGWMLDDCYDALSCLERIITKMKERAELHGIIPNRTKGCSDNE